MKIVTAYDGQLQVILERLNDMNYTQAKEYYEFANKYYNMTKSELLILLTAVEKLK